jgi:MinD-like ATPase involved in chromosome partitioning or flagellar assembly
MTTPVLATADPIVIDHVRSLAAAGNAPVQIVTSLSDLGTHWWGDALLLLGSDFVEGASGYAKRRNLAVVQWQFDGAAEIPSGLWQSALLLGAEHVVALPKAIGGTCGGAGASTLSVGLAAAAQKAGHRVLLIDGDLAGGGLDLFLGAETQQGVRWPELAFSSGRMSAETFITALPKPHGLALISASRESRVTPTQEAWQSILECAMHAFDVVVIDIGRQELPDSTHATLHDCRTPIWWVVPTRIRAVAAAAVVLKHSSPHWLLQDIIVRKVDRSMSPNDIGRALGTSIRGSLPEDPGVVAASEQGLLPKGAYAKACDEIFREWWAR